MKFHPFRTLGVAFALSLCATTVPAALAGQTALEVTPGCVTGCSQLRFDLVSGPAPLALGSLELTLLGGWTFADALFSAQDEFGPFKGTGLLSAGGSTVFLNFLLDPGFPLELADRSRGFVQLGVSGSGQVAFDWAATEVDGTVRSGSFSAPATNVVPEPVSMVLLGTGLAGVGLARRRKRESAASHH